jgi:hypothetical protein
MFDDESETPETTEAPHTQRRRQADAVLYDVVAHDVHGNVLGRGVLRAYSWSQAQRYARRMLHWNLGVDLYRIKRVSCRRRSEHAERQEQAAS